MFSIALILVLVGFFVLYAGSRKARFVPNGPVGKWASTYPVPARSTGIVLVLTAFILLIWNDGVAVGLFKAMLLLMTIACIMVSVAPLRYFNTWHIALIVLISLFLELIIF